MDRYTIEVKTGEQKWKSLSVSFKAKPSDSVIQDYIGQYGLNNQINPNRFEYRILNNGIVVE